MQTERWKRIEDLCQAALAHPAEKRAAFLAQRCPDDPELRGEVQSLLDQQADSSLEGAPLSAVRTLGPGAKLGNFEIVDLLGRGGMGEVWRARDVRLRREVAIKVLPASMARDPDRVARFEGEARAASALNHANIVAIYDVGHAQGTYWIASELVNGETLRRMMEGGPLPAARVIEIAEQAAEGLAAAHAVGLVHRDLKPENIMVTRGGQVKILDFGLAKQQNPAPGSTTAYMTREGTVLGTAGYMSPEQARGEAVDHRSDLFSFGVVLYEMLSGTRAFQGDSPVETMNAILKSDPPGLPATVPLPLDRIARRCLEKDPARRFQTAADLAFALQSCSAPSWHPAALPATDSAIIASLIRGRKRIVLGIVTGAATLIAAAWFFLHRPPGPASPPSEPIQQRLTFNASENPARSAVLSPDGKYLAYADRGGIHVKLLSTSEDRLTPRPAGVPADADWSPTAWFPDGTRLLANTSLAGKHDSMWTVSLLGQPARKLREDAIGYELSPDGAQVAFSPYAGRALNHREVWVMGIQGDNPHKVLAAGENESIPAVHWSPDGQRLAYAILRLPEGPASIQSCDLKGTGKTVVLAQSPFPDFWWLPQGRLVFALQEKQNTSEWNLWALGIDNHEGTPIGKPKRMTQWSGSLISDFSASADGKRLVVNKQTSQDQVYVGELTAGGTRMNTPRRLTSDEAANDPTAWTADSKAVLFLSDRSGKWGIFKQELNHDTADPLFTGQEDAGFPQLSADGAWILFLEHRARGIASTGPKRLMRIPAGGGVPQFVMETHNELSYRCAIAPSSLCIVAEASEDQQQLVISAFDPIQGRGKVLRTVPRDSPDTRTMARVSPDGLTLAVAEDGEPEIRIRLLSLAGAADGEVTVKNWPDNGGIAWALDGKGFYTGSASAQGCALLYVGLKGNARVLWQRNGPCVTWGVPSPDGRHLAILGAVESSNAWMLEGF